MKKMSKDDFKAFSKHFRNMRVNFFHDNTGVEVDDFCAMLSQHDPQLAVKVKAWHSAQNDLAKHVEDRSEGAQPDMMLCRINGL